MSNTAQKIQEPTETEQVIAGMMKENTGRHFLDSGGAYGRAWERNQCREFALEAESVLKWDYDYISVVHNLYHWLVSRLEYNAELTEAFDKFSAEQDSRSYLSDMEEWANQIGGAGIYGECNPMTVNSYNGEELLSQVIQFTYFTLDDADQFEETAGGAFVLLQIHGGADVRGGYTAPKVFEVCGGSDGTEIFDYARGGIGCSDCDANWMTDDGHSWYADGACGYGAGTQLEAYDVTKADDDEKWEEGSLHVTEDNDLLCPCCGGKLSAGFY